MKYCCRCMNAMEDNEEICSRCGMEQRVYVAPPHILSVGTVINGRYLIGGIIGEGGFGITYIGLDTLLKYRVAVKEFYPNGMVTRNNTVSTDVHTINSESSQEFFYKARENFLREAQTLARFNEEPSIVSVKDFFDANNTVYIVMEYLEGITLKQHLYQLGGKMYWREAVSLLMPVLYALRKIHSEGLIHRDISPDNIMIVKGGIKLLDFGAAREYTDEKSLSVMLKHGYAPFEQYTRRGDQGAWTDIYAFCATLYKCITGETPLQATDRIVDDTLKMPTELGIEANRALDDALRRGLAVMVKDRIQNVDELIVGLQAALAERESVSERAPLVDEGEVTVMAGYNESEPTVSEPTSVILPEDEPEKPPESLTPPEQPKPPKPKKIIAAVVCIAVIGCVGGVAALKMNKGGGTVDGAKTLQTTEAAKSNVIPQSGNGFEIEQQDGEYVLTKYSGEGGDVVIPDGVTGIGKDAFYKCKSLTSVTIPESVTYIGVSAFNGCVSLTSVTIPAGVTDIGVFAFNGCESLTSVTIPGSVTSIYDGAFFGCTSLTSVTIPDSVESIGDRAFLKCESLTSINIPDSMTNIGDDAFAYCYNLTIKCKSGSYAEEYAKANEINYITDTTETTKAAVIPESGNGFEIEQQNGEYVLTKYTGDGKNVVIPDGVTGIGNYAFDACKSLTSITIPDSVTSIGKFAFYDCKSLTSITLPDGVTSIGTDAFAWCESLTSIKLPNSVTSIGNWAFEDCTSLTSITIPDSITSIGDDSFRNCKSLTSVTIPDSVESIGDRAFLKCESLTSINIPDSITSIGDDSFRDCKSLTSIIIPDSVTSIRYSAFWGCDKLTIICKAGSCAEEYAKNNNIKYELID